MHVWTQSLENIDDIVVRLNGRGEGLCASLACRDAGQPFGSTDGIQPSAKELMVLATSSLLNSRAEVVPI